MTDYLRSFAKLRMNAGAPAMFSSNQDKPGRARPLGEIRRLVKENGGGPAPFLYAITPNRGI